MAPIRLHWQLTSPVDLETVWRTFANTDRFNRACGLGFRFEEHSQPDGTVRRVGEARKFGLRLRWEELPFQVHAPSGFVSERRFGSGPLARLVTTLALTETPTHTAIDYTVELHPRSVLLKPLVAADAAMTIRPMLDRTLKRVLASLLGQVALDPPPALPDDARRALARWQEAGPDDDPVRAAIARRIHNAPLDAQDRLKPLEVAAEVGCDERQAIEGFLDGVRSGVLELRWELLCPSCRQGKDTAPTLGAGPAEVHCSSCNIRFDATFPDRVAVVFRPAPAIRQFEVPIDCLLSPSRTPHVLGQGRIDIGEELELALDLPAGGYQLDARPALGAAVLQVREGLPDHDLVVDVTDAGVRPGVLRLAPGRRRLKLRNRTSNPVLLTLERSWLPPHTLTAGHLLELPGAAELLPPDSVAPGLAATTRAMVVVAASTSPPRQGEPAALVPALAALVEQAPVSAAAGHQVICAFDDRSDAIGLVRRLADDTSVQVGISEGLVVVMSLKGRRVPTGSTVERALSVMRSVGLGRVGVHASHKDDPSWMRTLEEAALHARDPGRFCHLTLHQPGTGHPPTALPPEAPPRACGRYEVLDELARGAHGIVLAARERDTGRPAVVKLLVAELADDPAAAQRFYAEARYTAHVTHPNVVRVLDWGSAADGRLYLVLERLLGETVADTLDRGPMPVDAVVALASDALSALAATHAAGVLHRDLKPANLFRVASDPVVTKVLDFGIAHRLGTEDPALEAGYLLGTPLYMSPEQVDAKPLDGRSDLYALSLVLYECLSGRLPFDEGGADYQIAMRRVLGDPLPLRDAAPHVPEALAGWVMRGLDKDPDDRWPDALTMAESLPT